MENGTLSFPRSLLIKKTDQVFFTRTPAASTFSGTVNIGDAPFDGISSGTFVGSSSGNLLAINSLAAFSGTLLSCANAGSSRFVVNSTGTIRIAAQVSGATNAILSLGSGSYSTTAVGGFAGSSSGTIIGCVATNGYAGNLIDLQIANASTTPNTIADVRIRLDSTGQLFLPQPAVAQATTGLINLGSGSFAGGGAPAFNSSSSGTIFAINAVSGYAGNLIDAQVAGVSEFKLTAAGNATFTGTVVGTNLPAVAAKGDLIIGTSANNASVKTVGSDADILVADSNNSAGLSYIMGPWQKWQSNGWYSSSPGASTSNTLGNNNLRVTAVFIPNRCTLQTIAAEVTSAGSTGSVIRLGIWNDNGTGFPGTLLLDAGTIDGTSVTVQSKAINQVIGPGLYWLGAALQGTPTTDPTMRVTSSSGLHASAQLGYNAGTTAPTNNAILGYSMTQSTTFVDYSGTIASVAGQAVRVMVRVL